MLTAFDSSSQVLNSVEAVCRNPSLQVVFWGWVCDGFALSDSCCKSRFLRQRCSWTGGPSGLGGLIKSRSLGAAEGAYKMPASLLLLYQHELPFPISYGDLQFFLNNCGHKLAQFHKEDGIDPERCMKCTRTSGKFFKSS